MIVVAVCSDMALIVPGVFQRMLQRCTGYATLTPLSLLLCLA